MSRIHVEIGTKYADKHNGRELLFDTFVVHFRVGSQPYVACGTVLDHIDEADIADKIEDYMLHGVFDHGRAGKDLFIVLTCLHYICRWHDSYDIERVPSLLEKITRHAVVTHTITRQPQIECLSIE